MKCGNWRSLITARRRRELKECYDVLGQEGRGYRDGETVVKEAGAGHNFTSKRMLSFFSPPPATKAEIVRRHARLASPREHPKSPPYYCCCLLPFKNRVRRGK